jgi:hypothetical protein
MHTGPFDQAPALRLGDAPKPDASADDIHRVSHEQIVEHVFSAEVRKQQNDLTQQIDALRAEVRRLRDGFATDGDAGRLARQARVDRARCDAVAKEWTQGNRPSHEETDRIPVRPADHREIPL